MASPQWLFYALAGMVFAGLANLSLKILVKDHQLLKQNYSALAPIVAVALLGLLIAYIFFFRNAIPNGLVQWGIALIVFGLLAFTATIYALESGKVALVSAVLSLSTVFVAILSAVFLGDQFSTKEIAAIVLATAAAIALVM